MFKISDEKIPARWLRLKDAGSYLAIRRSRLVQLAEDGEVKGFKDPDSGRHDWIFDRYSLDSYREEGTSEAQIELMVADIHFSRRKKRTDTAPCRSALWDRWHHLAP